MGDERPAWRQDQGKLPEFEAPLLIGLRFPLQAFEVNRVNPGIAIGIRYGQQRDHDPRCGAPISQVDETLDRARLPQTQDPEIDEPPLLGKREPAAQKAAGILRTEDEIPWLGQETVRPQAAI